MRLRMRMFPLLARAAVGIGLLAASAGSALALDPVQIKSARGFDDTVQQLQWALGGFGVTTVAAMDYREIMKKMKVDTGRAVVFEVMRREWARRLLAEDPALGILMPVRVYVYENASATTFVSYAPVGAQTEGHPAEAMRALGRQIDEKVREIVNQATLGTGSVDR